MKSLQEILNEAGYQEPDELYTDVPDPEPCRPKREWMTIRDLFTSAAGTVDWLRELVMSLVSVAFWLVFIAFLIFCMTSQCNGHEAGGYQVDCETSGHRSIEGWEIATAVSFLIHSVYEHVLNIGETGSTKSNTEKIVRTEQALEDDTVVVWFDPQPDSSGKSFYDGCCELGIACVHVDLDSDLNMPVRFLAPSGDARIDEKNISLLLEALGAYKGHERTYNRVLTFQYLRPMCLVQMYTELPWWRLKDAWNSDINGDIIRQCRHQDAIEFLRNLPRRGSTLNREIEPARRFVEVLMNGPSIRLMDSQEDRFIECLNEGNSVVFSGGNMISQREACFLFSFRLMQIFDASMQGKLKFKVKIVLEEADLQGVPLQVVRGLQGLAKYGVMISLISQNGFFGDEDGKTELIWNNTGRLIHRLSGEQVLERAVKDLSMLFEPHFVKQRRHILRQIQSGWEEIDTESETLRKMGSSKTIGKRLIPKHIRYWETQESYMPLYEQAALLKGVISRFGNGQGIYKLQDIDTFKLPRYEEWVGRKREEIYGSGFVPTQVQQSNWLKQTSVVRRKSPEDTSNDFRPEDIFGQEGT